MQPKKNASLAAYENFNKLSLFVFIVCFAVVGYDLWLVSKAAQPPTRVMITPAQFSPQNVVIKVGQAVVWTNQDNSAHWIASDPYPLDNQLPRLNSSGPVTPTNSYSYTFDRSGTYSYHDELHPNQLRGTVTVK